MICSGMRRKTGPQERLGPKPGKIALGMIDRILRIRVGKRREIGDSLFLEPLQNRRAECVRALPGRLLPRGPISSVFIIRNFFIFVKFFLMRAWRHTSVYFSFVCKQ